MNKESPEAPQAPQVPETLPVENLDEFVHIISGWHGNRVQQLRHMSEIPLGTKIQVDDGKHLLMKGNLRKGFKLGLELAIGIIGTLPFAAEHDDEPAPKAADH